MIHSLFNLEHVSQPTQPQACLIVYSTGALFLIHVCSTADLSHIVYSAPGMCHSLLTPLTLDDSQPTQLRACFEAYSTWSLIRSLINLEQVHSLLKLEHDSQLTQPRASFIACLRWNMFHSLHNPEQVSQPTQPGARFITYSTQSKFHSLHNPEHVSQELTHASPSMIDSLLTHGHESPLDGRSYFYLFLGTSG